MIRMCTDPWVTGHFADAYYGALTGCGSTMDAALDDLERQCRAHAPDANWLVGLGIDVEIGDSEQWKATATAARLESLAVQQSRIAYIRGATGVSMRRSVSTSGDPCLQCEKRPPLPAELYCEDCAQARAERVYERFLEGDGPVGVQEQWERAHRERRRLRGSGAAPASSSARARANSMKRPSSRPNSVRSATAAPWTASR